MPEAVDHPEHYGGDMPYEAIKVIEAWEPEWRKRGLGGFSLGSAVKYICRAGAKGDAILDLEKAKRYIEFEIDRVCDAGTRESPLVDADEEITGASLNSQEKPA